MKMLEVADGPDEYPNTHKAKNQPGNTNQYARTPAIHVQVLCTWEVRSKFNSIAMHGTMIAKVAAA